MITNVRPGPRRFVMLHRNVGYVQLEMQLP
jgi:hypothetical protein